jgi:hypothetical protein
MTLCQEFWNLAVSDELWGYQTHASSAQPGNVLADTRLPFHGMAEEEKAGS